MSAGPNDAASDTEIVSVAEPRIRAWYEDGRWLSLIGCLIALFGFVCSRVWLEWREQRAERSFDDEVGLVHTDHKGYLACPHWLPEFIHNRIPKEHRLAFQILNSQRLFASGLSDQLAGL